jgi:hypothetical protein
MMMTTRTTTTTTTSTITPPCLPLFTRSDVAACCADPLTRLGYTVRLITDFLPPDTTLVLSKDLREAMEQKGCCGMKEFLELYVYTLVDYPLAIHLDTDALIVCPMDPLYDAILPLKRGNKEVKVIRKKEENDGHEKTTRMENTTTTTTTQKIRVFQPGNKRTEKYSQ